MSNEVEREAYHKWKSGAEPYGFNGFTAFQAGAEWQRSQHSAPAGYRMVPVKPTPEMLDCIMDWQKIGNVTAYRAMLAASPKAEQPSVQEPYAIECGFDNGDGTYSVRIKRMPLPSYEKPHKDWPVRLLYASPVAQQKVVMPDRTQAQPADALVEGLETIALESTDEQARCCAHHYLATYRAAQEKKI